MWMRTNPNPAHKEVSDSVIRAIAIALGARWLDIYDDLCRLGREEFNLPNADAVWSKYLHNSGFEPFLLPENDNGINIEEFCREHPEGTYIVGTGSHPVAVLNGDYYDSWDSGNEVPSFFWRKIKMEET